MKYNAVRRNHMILVVFKLLLNGIDLTNDSDGLSALRRFGLSDQTLTLELEKPTV